MKKQWFLHAISSKKPFWCWICGEKLIFFKKTLLLAKLAFLLWISSKWSSIISLDPDFFTLPANVNVILVNLLNRQGFHVCNIMSRWIKMLANSILFISSYVSSMVSESFTKFPLCFSNINPITFFAPNFINDIFRLTVERRCYSPTFSCSLAFVEGSLFALDARA